MSASAGERSMMRLPATLTASSVASIGSATDQKIATPPPSGIGSWWILRVPGRSTSPRRGANRFIASVMSHERTKLTAARIRMGTIMRGAAREDNRAAQSKKEETPNRGLSVHLPCKTADAIGGPVRSRQSRPQVLDLRLDLLELPVQHPLVLGVVRVLHAAADVAGFQLKALNFGNRVRLGVIHGTHRTPPFPLQTDGYDILPRPMRAGQWKSAFCRLCGGG